MRGKSSRNGTSWVNTSGDDTWRRWRWKTIRPRGLNAGDPVDRRPLGPPATTATTSQIERRGVSGNGNGTSSHTPSQRSSRATPHPPSHPLLLIPLLFIPNFVIPSPLHPSPSHSTPCHPTPSHLTLSLSPSPSHPLLVCHPRRSWGPPRGLLLCLLLRQSQSIRARDSRGIEHSSHPFSHPPLHPLPHPYILTLTISPLQSPSLLHSSKPPHPLPHIPFLTFPPSHFLTHISSLTIPPSHFLPHLHPTTHYPLPTILSTRGPTTGVDIPAGGTPPVKQGRAR